MTEVSCSTWQTLSSTTVALSELNERLNSSSVWSVLSWEASFVNKSPDCGVNSFWDFCTSTASWTIICLSKLFSSEIAELFKSETSIISTSSDSRVFCPEESPTLSSELDLILIWISLTFKILGSRFRYPKQCPAGKFSLPLVWLTITKLSFPKNSSSWLPSLQIKLLSSGTFSISTVAFGKARSSLKSISIVFDCLGNKTISASASIGIFLDWTLCMFSEIDLEKT